MSCSQTVDYHKDFSVRDLTTAESLLLVSFRLWALHQAQGPEAALPSWRTGLDSVGLAGAVDLLFCPLMETVFSGARRVPEVQQMGCRRISRDESVFLGCIANYHHQQMLEAEILLARWLQPTAVRVASSLAMRLAAALEAVHLSLPLRYGARAGDRPYRIAATYRHDAGRLH